MQSLPPVPYPTTPGKTTGDTVGPSIPKGWWDLPVDPTIYNPVQYPEGPTGGEEIYTDYGNTTGDFTGGLPEYTDYGYNPFEYWY